MVLKSQAEKDVQYFKTFSLRVSIWLIKNIMFIILHKTYIILFLKFTVVDLSSHSFQTTSTSGNIHRQDRWNRDPHTTSIPPFLMGAQGNMGIGSLDSHTSNNAIADGGLPRRRRQSLTEADLSSALSCPACGKMFAGSKRRYHLERHLITHTGERPYPCPHCPYRANVRENLARHVRHRHPDVLVTSFDAWKVCSQTFLAMTVLYWYFSNSVLLVYL